MKKQITLLVIAMGLLFNPMLSAISPKRLWECATAPEKYNCTESEKKTARGWLIGGSITAIIAVLVAIGLIRGPQAAKEGKRIAADAKINALRAQRVEVTDYNEMKKIDNDIAYWTEERSKYTD